MTTLAEVALRFKGDYSQLLKDAKSGGSQAGKEAESGFTSGFHLDGKTLFAGFGAGASVAFGIAAKGLLDLDNATQKYAADTGASQQDLAAMQATVLDLNRHNLENIGQITDVIAILRTSLGLTQAEADGATQSFLNYAKATGQDAATATGNLTTVLKAWNLSVSDAQPLMDQLVVSHQRYGTSITEDQDALARLAPALQASNTSLSDAIGFLDLAAKSGIDAGNATAALNRAVKELKPGQSLDDLIKQVASIEDPTLRAQEAIKVFGQRGGVQLSQALKPGVDSLAAFGISTADAAGATDKAASEIDSSITNQIGLAIKNVGGALIQFAAPAGPILNMVGSLGFALPAISKLVGGITAIGDALTLQAATAGLKWLAILGPLAVVAAAGVVTIVGLQKADEALGGAAARTKAQQDELNHAFQNFDGTLGLTAAQLAEVAAYTAGTGAAAANATPPVAGLTEKYDALFAKFNSMQGIGSATGESLTAAQRAIQEYSTNFGYMADGTIADTERVVTSLGKLPPAAQKIGFDTLSKLAQGITDARQQPVDAMNTLVEMMKHPLSVTAETTRLIGELTGKNLAAGLTSSDPAIRTEADAVKASILTRLDAIKPHAGTVSTEAMAELVKGMKSSDPDIKAAATAIYNKVIGKDSPLPDMPGKGKKIGSDTTTDLGGGLSSGITTHVTPTINTGKAKIGELDLSSKARGWGSGTMASYAEGLSSGIGAVTTAVNTGLGAVRSIMAASSPPGPASPLHLIDVWGKNTGTAWVEGLSQGLAGAPDVAAAALAAAASAFNSGKQANPMAGAGAAGFAAYAGAQGVAFNPVSGVYQATDAHYQRDPSWYAQVHGDISANAEGGLAGGNPSGGINVTVYNPAPEPASTSTSLQLRKLAAFGALP